MKIPPDTRVIDVIARCVFTVIVLVLAMTGCDKVNPRGQLSPIIASTGAVQSDFVPRRIADAELLSKQLPALDEVLLGKRFDAYEVGELSVQSVGAQWSAGFIGIRILVKNSGTVPLDIPLDKTTFVPKKVSKARHKVGKEFEPFIAFIYFGHDDASIFVIPEGVEPRIAFMPSVKSNWSNVFDAIEPRLQSYYADFQGHLFKGAASSVAIPPERAAFVYLVFPVGFVESGELFFPVDGTRAVQIQFTDLKLAG